MEPARPLRPEDYKCWICLETDKDNDNSSNYKREWRRICRCNLVAHESCLLQWADLNALNNDSVVRSAVCPQCQRPIVVVEDKSMFLQYRDSFERSSSIFIKLMAGATIGGGILTTVYTTLYTLGATTVRFMCSNEMALDILGIVVKDRGVEIKPISIRNALMIPTIPFALILSRSPSPKIGLMLCLLPLGLGDLKTPPWKFSGPRLAITALPFLRLLYFSLYKLVAQPLIDANAKKMKSDRYKRGSSGIGIDGINVEVIVEQPEGFNRNNNRNQDGADDNDNILNNNNGNEAVENQGLMGEMLSTFFEWLLRNVNPNNELGIFEDDMDEDENQPERQENNQDQDLPPNGNVQVNGRVRNNINNNNNRQRAPQTDSDWAISPRRLSLTIGNALLLPFCSNIVGSVLSTIPIVRTHLPDVLYQNLLAGILVIGVKDVVNVASTYFRVKSEQSTHVLQYEEAERLSKGE